MRRLLVLLLLGGCLTPIDPPIDPDGIVAVTRESIEATLAGEPLDARLRSDVGDVALYDRYSATPSGMAGRLELLNAVSWRDRETRVDLLERVEDDAADQLLARTAVFLLEQDEAYLACELRADRFYSVFASFFNGVVKMAYSALTANPIGVVRPILGGVDTVLGIGELEPRDRKEIDLYRSWLRKVPGGEGLPADPRTVRARIAEQEDETFAEEVLLTGRLIDDGALDAAAAHLHVARTRRPEAEDVARLERRLETRVTTRHARLGRSLEIDPLEMELVRGAPDLNRRYRALVESILLGRPDPPFAEVGRQAATGGHADLAAALERAAAALEYAVDLDAPVRRAKREHVGRRRLYILTGRRVNEDPFQRYRVAQEEAHRSLGEILEPIFWVPATLARTVFATFTDPVDNQPVIDALAALAWRLQPGPRRDAVLTDLAERYEDRGETGKALAAARLLPEAGQRVARLEESLAADVLQRSGGETEEARQRTLELIIERFPDTEAAAQAQAELDEILTDVYSGATALPAVALLPLAEMLGIDPRLLDGREDNGEVERPGLRYLGDRLLFEVKRGGARERVTVPVDDSVRVQLDSLAAEWSWRRRAARTATYRELHEGVPVELRAGVGAQGVGIYPRLLPEMYSGEDRELFE